MPLWTIFTQAVPSKSFRAPSYYGLEGKDGAQTLQVTGKKAATVSTPMAYVNLNVWNVKRPDECKGFSGSKASK